ncbi:hypothetical protein DDE18_21555 [Nocardioides gansuensis]|uniref:Exo-alpha-sialidase n=1 Tax=Nocardioides gansuensis TaxID=2138300 RepID=A0A2T8F4U2_9ACTN|nr:hypothetical protein DDE18_21555 [Nocardioides gansuensis]
MASLPGAPRSSGRAAFVVVAVAACLLAGLAPALSLPVQARDRVPVLLGPVEPLAEWPQLPDDDTESPVLVRDGDGVTAFLQEGCCGVVYARERMRGGTWSPEQEVPCVWSGMSTDYCKVYGAAVGVEGELVALVHLFTGRRTALAISVRAAGQTSWSDPQLISDGYVVAGNTRPTIRGTGAGALLVTFGDFRRGRPDALIAAHLRPGQTWDAATYHRLPNVQWPQVSGLSRRGRAVVIYSNDPGLTAPVLVARFIPGHGWAKPTRIGTGWTENYAVAMGLGGRAVATWLETNTDSTGSTLTTQSQRVRLMTRRGHWSRAWVLARGERGTSGNARVWIHGEAGVAWSPWIGDAVRVAAKPVGEPWQKETIAGGRNGGPLRVVDINPAGNLVLTWVSWREGVGDRLVLALRPRGSNWSAPRIVYTDQDTASGSALVRRSGSAIVAYGDDNLQQGVARRAYLDRDDSG